MTKQQNEMINQYILDAIDTEGYNVNCNTDKEKLLFLYDTFKKECYYHLSKDGYFKSFYGWCQGLPSSFNIEFANHKIIELAKSWGSLPENATDKQIDKILENYWDFMTVKTFQLFKKYKIIKD
jgi:hypothetical protein